LSEFAHEPAAGVIGGFCRILARRKGWYGRETLRTIDHERHERGVAMDSRSSLRAIRDFRREDSRL